MNRLITVFALVLLTASAVAQGDPCKLLTPAEMESVLGMKVSGFTHGSAPGGTLTCNGDAGKGKSVGLMLSMQKPGDPKIADPMSWLEDQNRESAKRIGGQVEMKRFGSSILCTSLITPKMGLFNTQCYAFKTAGMAAITVLVPTQQELVSMEKLRPLGEKLLGRF